nr:hypothetical protein [Tanacetum cinerariifolium]
PEREVGYGITDSWDEIVEALQGAPGQVTALQGQVIALQAQVTALQGQHGLTGGPT